MMITKFEKLPSFMQTDEVKKYYEILKKKKVSLFFKRVFDIIMSLIMIVLLSPVMLVIAICIKCDSKGTVFFRQERVTKNGKVFRIFKFRTMVQDADKKGTLVTVGNDLRITKVGNKIRKCRLDELPQLFNVFVGDMSFVGTRPEVKKYVDKYSNEMNATLLMPAGITSTASINYKDEDEIIDKYVKEGKSVDEVYVEKILEEKMKWNLKYIEEFSFINDIVICFKTVIGVLK